jgi:hypothetical protein
MTPKVAFNFLLKEIERQDPTGHCDTLIISEPLAKSLCRSTELDIPLVVLQQDGIDALLEHDILGYDVRIDPMRRGYEVTAIIDSFSE